FWLLDVLAALFGYREFLNGVFGRNAAATPQYLSIWTLLFAAIAVIISGSLILKNQAHPMAAIILAAIPLVLAVPYALFFGVLLLGGNKNWR
ncbi:MAG: hypothetical protein ABIO24_12640, partial [Saprospiraceae bacterium]